MATKPKSGQIQTFQVRDPVNRQLMRDTSGKLVTIKNYTAKAARHQAKAMFQQSVIVEPAT